MSELDRLPWRQRPRRSLSEVLPRDKFTAVLWTLPYVCLGTLVYWAARGWRPDDVENDVLPELVALSAVSVAQSITFAAWLRRPHASCSWSRYLGHGSMVGRTFTIGE